MVEQGGILLGSWDQDRLTVKDLVYIPNFTSRANRFVVKADILNQYINRRDFVGLFHTHLRVWLPSLGDHISSRRLADLANHQIVIGIFTRKPYFWLYKPEAWLPRLLTQFELQVDFEKKLH